MDRAKPGTNGKLHCNQSADGFCDTPADYNLGFGFQGPGCVYTGCAKDPDNVKLDPNEANLMSYFWIVLKTFQKNKKQLLQKIIYLLVEATLKALFIHLSLMLQMLSII